MRDILYTKIENKKGTVWQYRFEIAPVDGRRRWKSKSGFATKKDAMEAGKAALKNYENYGGITSPSEMSFSDLLEFWIEHDASQTCKPATIDAYRKKIRLYINPKLGEYRVKTITRQHIKDFLSWMYNEGFSPNTISSCKGIITKCMDYAVDNNYLYATPASRVKDPSKGGKAPDTPTRRKPHVYVQPEEMDTIFERFPEGTPNHIALMLGYHCGLRLSETFALTWDDIDLERKTLEVNRQILWQPDRTRKDIKEKNGTSEAGGGFWYFDEPKYGSYRTISIDDELTDLLKREKERQEKAEVYYAERYSHYYVDRPIMTGGGSIKVKQGPVPVRREGKFPVRFVSVREDGSYITPRTMQNTSSVIHHKLGMPDFDFHSLRHTHATMLRESHAPDLYIQRRLGHKSSDVTMDVYANHLTVKMIAEGNKKLNELF